MSNPATDGQERSQPHNDDLMLKKIPCTKQQNKLYRKLKKAGRPLPEGVFGYPDDDTRADKQFYTVGEAAPVNTELLEYLQSKQLYMKNIITLYFILMAAAVLVGVGLFVLMISLR